MMDDSAMIMTPATREAFREWERAGQVLTSIRALRERFADRDCLKETQALAETWCANARADFHDNLREQTPPAPVELVMVDKSTPTE